MVANDGEKRRFVLFRNVSVTLWGATNLILIHISHFNPLALELDIYSLAHHLCKMCIFYEPRRVTLGNTRHFVEE